MLRSLVPTLVATSISLLALPALAQPVVTYVKSGATFDDVRDDLKTAIEGKGFVVDYEAQIGRMLERTGKDLGATKPLFANAQSLQFCSAKLSRKLMEADATTAVLCPYSIVVYATAARPDQVMVSYRRPAMPGKATKAARGALRELDALLDGLAREAAGRK
jgi:uncharacterized protein (DUF302 family)